MTWILLRGFEKLRDNKNYNELEKYKEGTANEVFSNSEVQNAYLGSQYR